MYEWETSFPFPNWSTGKSLTQSLISRILLLRCGRRGLLNCWDWGHIMANQVCLTVSRFIDLCSGQM